MNSQLKWQTNRRVVLCITGGIAAYKIPSLVRSLITAGCEVRIAMSRAAEQFVTPMVLSTLSHEKVWREEDFLSTDEGWKIPHISLADWAEIVVVAPCTADRLAAAATGGAGTLIDAIVLATKAPVLFFPAMNPHMLENPATQQNIETLRSRGHTVAASGQGMMACGYTGDGRLPEREEILAEIWRLFEPRQDLKGRKILITAGPTREYLDPVRFISNPSSGKMGYALARTAMYRGAVVQLISGPVDLKAPEGVEVIPVTSALEMFEAVKEHLNDSDAIAAVAAVSDYRPEEQAEHKIKREALDRVERSFVQNPDIAAWVGANKKPEQILLGFAAETDDLAANALRKMERKQLNLIAANDVLAADAGFGTETNRVTLYHNDGSHTELSGSKDQVADAIWDSVVPLLG